MKNFKSFEINEEISLEKFDALVRAGLANKAQLQRLHNILQKMHEKDDVVLSRADRMIVTNLFNKMLELITTDKSIFQKAKQMKTLNQFSEQDDVDIENLAKKLLGPTQTMGTTSTTQDASIKNVGRNIFTDLYGKGAATNPNATKPPSHEPFKNLSRPRSFDSVPDRQTSLARSNFNANIGNKMGFRMNNPRDFFEEEVEEYIEESSRETDKLPPVLILKRKSIRLFPNNVKVAIYHSDKLNRSFALPMTDLSISSVTEETAPSGVSQGGVIKTLREIIKGKAANVVEFKDGKKMKVDMYSAKAILMVYDAVDPQNKSKMDQLLNKDKHGFIKIADFALSKAKK